MGVGGGAAAGPLPRPAHVRRRVSTLPSMRGQRTGRSLVATLLIGLCCGAGSAQAQTPAPTAPPLPLSPERYRTLDPVLKAAITLDARKPKPARVRKADRACRALPRTDTLVAAFRATCRADVDAVYATVGITACKGIRRCITAIRRYAAAAGRQAIAGRAINKVLPAQVPDEPCRHTMRYRASELRVLDRLQATASSLEKAVRSQSAGQFKAALGRFFRVDRTKLQTHRARLSQFRIACR